MGHPAIGTSAIALAELGFRRLEYVRLRGGYALTWEGAGGRESTADGQKDESGYETTSLWSSTTYLECSSDAEDAVVGFLL